MKRHFEKRPINWKQNSNAKFIGRRWEAWGRPEMNMNRWNSLPALKEKPGGEFLTSTIIIKIVVEMIKPCERRQLFDLRNTMIN